MRRLILIGVTMAGLSGPNMGLLGQRPDVTVPATLVPPEIETLVREALEDRLDAEDLPEMRSFRASVNIAILDELPRARLKLSPAALPRAVSGHVFSLVTTASAQATADRTGKEFSFLFVDVPSIAGETATILMGRDVTLPREPNATKLCCCSATGEFRRGAGRWTFVRWQERHCG